MSETYLTVKQAAARVERSPRQVENWIAGGLQVYALDGDRRRFVREDELLAVLRSKLAARSSKWAGTVHGEDGR